MKCCICHKELPANNILPQLAGNDPFPYDTTPGARCCNDCSQKHVIPARAADIRKAIRKGMHQA